MRLVSKAGLDVKKKTVEALKTNLADDEAEGLDSDDETDLSDRLEGVDLEDSDQGLNFLAKARGKANLRHFSAILFSWNFSNSNI